MSTLYIFDADGTLRKCYDPKLPCPNKDNDWYIPREVRLWARQQPWRTVVAGIVSNQGGVSLGYLSEEQARKMLYDLFVELTGYHPIPGVVQMCTAMDKDDPRRKPNPGMIYEVQKTYVQLWQKPFDKIVMVGDMESDEQAAKNAGIDFVYANEFFSMT